MVNGVIAEVDYGRPKCAGQRWYFPGNATYPANLCPFYGDVAAIWSMVISSILHKRGADFKSFLGGLTGYLQRPDNPDACGVLLSKTDRTKRRNESLSRDYGRLI